MPKAATQYILDSDLVIQALRGDSAAQAAVLRYQGQYGLSVVTYLEVAVFELTKDARRFQTVKKSLAQETLHPLTGTATKQAARVQAQLLANNQQMGFQDLCIAATAVERKATLVTRNQRHFALYPGLKVQPW